MSPLLLIGVVVLAAAALSGSSKAGTGSRACATKLADAFLGNVSKAEAILKSPALDALKEQAVPIIKSDPAAAVAIQELAKCYGGDDDSLDVEQLKKCRSELVSAVTAVLDAAQPQHLRDFAGVLAQVAPQLHLHECLVALADKKAA